MDTILKIDNLQTTFTTKAGLVQAVRGVSFEVKRGEILGVVGESGSGKSVTSLSTLRILPDSAKFTADALQFDGQDLLSLSKREFRKIRGAKISMVFQDPMTSLNPLMTVGKQVEEAILEHTQGISKKEARQKALAFLKKVRIPDAENRYNDYPHQLSGGMRQRVMIAIALSCNPQLLIADEPTTALDVTIQNQIIELIREMRDEFNLSVIFITHDLGVVAEICDRVVVLYGGLVMEEGLIDEIFYNTAHPYTLGLLASVPKLSQDKNQRLIPIPGSPPDMLAPPKGCPFYQRCQWARTICIENRPTYKQISPTHKSMCWLLDADAPEEDNPFKNKGGNHDKT